MSFRRACVLALMWVLPMWILGACAPRDGSSSRTVVQQTPYGTQTTVYTTRTVDAPPPPARPADPYPGDPLVKYNIEVINTYRINAGVAPLVYDARLSAFALEGSRQYAADHTPHAHFAQSARGSQVFGSRSAENQGDPHGVPPMDGDPLKSGAKQIMLMMKMMFDEGPGGGHHDNMLNPRYRRAGIGLHTSGGKLYLTNDFSD